MKQNGRKQIDSEPHCPNKCLVLILELGIDHLIGLKWRISARSRDETTIPSKPHTANSGQQFEKYTYNPSFQAHITPQCTITSLFPLSLTNNTSCRRSRSPTTTTTTTIHRHLYPIGLGQLPFWLSEPVQRTRLLDLPRYGGRGNHT